MTERIRSVTFVLAGDAEVAVTLVGSYLTTLFPKAEISHAWENGTAPPGGVAVQLAGRDRWLFIVTSQQPELAARALQLGACAVVSLNAPTKDLERGLGALFGVAEDGVFVSDAVARAIGGAISSHRAEESRSRATLVHLTDRERQVLALLSRGLSNAEIASAMLVSVNTVRTYLHSLSLKLGQSGRAKLVHEATQLGVMESKYMARTVHVG